MSLAALLAYAYLIGAAFAACVGYFTAWRSGQAPSLRPPFVSPDHVFRSLLLVSAAGPFLLISELKAARADSAISIPFAVTGVSIATGWALASGILLVELMALCSKILM